MTTKVEPTVEKKLKYVRCTECVECRKLLTEEMLERFDKIFYGRDYFTNSDSYEEVKKFIKEEYEKSEIVTHPARFCCNDDFTPISPTVEKWEEMRSKIIKLLKKHELVCNRGECGSLADGCSLADELTSLLSHSLQQAREEERERCIAMVWGCQRDGDDEENEIANAAIGEVAIKLSTLKDDKSDLLTKEEE